MGAGTGSGTGPDPERRPLTRREYLVLIIHRGLDKKLSSFGVWVMRRTKGSLAGLWHVDVLILTTTGRRTGRSRSVVLQYFRDGGEIILAAANGGEPTDPAWYLNLVARPWARVEIAGRAMEVCAEILSVEESARWWRRIEELAPDYRRYARATSRPIPIVRLRRLVSSRQNIEASAD